MVWKLGRVPEARELFTRGIAACPRSGPLWMEWAAMEWGEGDTTTGRKLFERGSRVPAAYQHAPLYEAWARLELAAGNVLEAARLTAKQGSLMLQAGAAKGGLVGGAKGLQGGGQRQAVGRSRGREVGGGGNIAVTGVAATAGRAATPTSGGAVGQTDGVRVKGRAVQGRRSLESGSSSNPGAGSAAELSSVVSERNLFPVRVVRKVRSTYVPPIVPSADGTYLESSGAAVPEAAGLMSNGVSGQGDSSGLVVQ